MLDAGANDNMEDLDKMKPSELAIQQGNVRRLFALNMNSFEYFIIFLGHKSLAGYILLRQRIRDGHNPIHYGD